MLRYKDRNNPGLSTQNRSIESFVQLNSQHFMSDIKTAEPAERKNQVLKFAVSLLLAVILAYFLKQPGFSDSQVYVLFILFFAIGLWFTEAIPAFAVSLLIIAFLVFALGNKNLNSSPEKVDIYVNTFSSSVIWLLLGGFFLASAMTKTKLDAALLRFTIRVSGTNPKNLLIGLMTTTMMASMIMSNTATTAMVMASLTPLIHSLGKKSGVGKALLLGVPIAASTGGMATIIGSPPNAIAVGALESAGMQMDFLTWMLYGLPIALLLTAIACFALIKMYMKDAPSVSLDFFEDAAAAGGDLKRHRRIVVVVLILTVLLWLTGEWNGLTVASVCALPLVVLTLTGVITGKDVQRLPWDTLLLVAGGLSLGVALQHTGLLSYYAERISSMNFQPVVFLFILAYLAMIFSNVMSHTATSTVLIPLGLVILTHMKIEVSVIIALAASTAMLLPVSTPPNAIAYSTGMIEQKDFRLGGLLVGLLGPALIVLWILFISTN